MGVRVNPNTAVDVAVSFIQPVFTASWFEVEITAEVTFPDRLVVDVISPIDLVALNFAKSLSSATAGFTDNFVLDFNKKPSDLISMLDQADITYLIGKVFQDTPAVTELLAKSFTKAPFTDQTFLIDNMDGNIQHAFIKSVSEIQQLADANTLEPIKNLAEVVSVAELISTILVFIRSFNESVTPSDSFIPVFIKNFVELLSVNDQTNYVVTKSFFDSNVISENISKNITHVVQGVAQLYVDPTYFETQDYVQQAVTGDYIYMTPDEVIISKFIFKEPSDNITPLAALGISVQNYADITYFAEDFVGGGLPFTS